MAMIEDIRQFPIARGGTAELVKDFQTDKCLNGWK